MKNRIAVYDTDTHKYYVGKLNEMIDIDTEVKLTDNYTMILSVNDYIIDKKARKIKIDSFIDTDFFTSYIVYTIGSVKYIIKPHVTYVPKRYKGNFIYNHSYSEYAKTKIKCIDTEIKKLFNTNTVEY